MAQGEPYEYPILSMLTILIVFTNIILQISNKDHFTFWGWITQHNFSDEYEIASESIILTKINFSLLPPPPHEIYRPLFQTLLDIEDIHQTAY